MVTWKDLQHPLLWKSGCGIALYVHRLWGCIFFFAFFCIYLHLFAFFCIAFFAISICISPPPLTHGWGSAKSWFTKLHRQTQLCTQQYLPRYRLTPESLENKQQSSTNFIRKLRGGGT